MQNQTETGASENWDISFGIGKAVFAIVSSIICLLTAGGNVLVLLSFRVNKKLRTTNNYFLISLAIADSIIGFVSMPISSVYFITEKWLFGPYICDMYLSLDYTVSNASVASLLLISFDRYFSITRPLTYRVNRTTRKVAVLIALSWLISTLMWTPFILMWPYFHGKRIIRDDVCRVQFLSTNKYITLGTAFAAFYLPVTIICVVYYKIWMKTKKRQIEFRSLQAEQSSKTPTTGESNNRRKERSPSSETNPVSSKANNKNKSQVDIERSGSGEEKEIMLMKLSNTAAPNPHENRSKLKKFFKHLVDNEEEEETEPPLTNEISTTLSCEATTCRPSAIANEIGLNRTKSSLDTTTAMLDRQSGRGIIGWICRVCKGNKANSINTKTIDYSKCKLVYKSSRTATAQSIVANECLNNNNSYKYSDSGFSSTSEPRRYSLLRILYRLNYKNKAEKINNQVNTTIAKTAPQIKLCKFSDDDISVTKVDENNSPNGQPKPPKINISPLTKEYPPYSLENHQINRLIEYKKCSCNMCLMKDMEGQFDDSDREERPLSKKRISFEKEENSIMLPIRQRSNSFDPTGTHKSAENEKNPKFTKRLSAGSEATPRANLKAGDERRPITMVKSKTAAAALAISKQQRNSAELKKKSVANQRKKLEKKQDQKAAKTLSAILLAFILTWTPYNINVVANVFCDNCLDQFEMYSSFSYWLCYMNSTINPFLYALCNANFRKTFKEILKKFTCNKSKRR